MNMPDWTQIVWALMALVLVGSGLTFRRQQGALRWPVAAALWIGVFLGVFFIANLLGVSR